MIDEIRSFGSGDLFEGRPPFRVGVATGLGPLPAFKADADFVFTQISYSLDDLLHSHEGFAFDGQVYAGVMVVASAAMARKLSTENEQLSIPADVVERVERDPAGGVIWPYELAQGSGRPDLRRRAPRPGEPLPRGRAEARAAGLAGSEATEPVRGSASTTWTRRGRL